MKICAISPLKSAKCQEILSFMGNCTHDLIVLPGVAENQPTINSRTMKDPDSAKYQSITTPKKFWMANRFDGAKYGYLVCATVNGKNSYGGYVGYRTDGLLIRNGSVIDYIDRGMMLNGNNVCN